MRLATVLALAGAALLAQWPGAHAQAPAEGGGPVELDVRRVVVPESKGKLVRRGVSVRAGCAPECVIVVKVSLPRSVAAKLGLRDRVIASGIGASGGTPVWIRAPLRRRAAGLLAGYEGGGRLQVRIRALS